MQDPVDDDYSDDDEHAGNDDDGDYPCRLSSVGIAASKEATTLVASSQKQRIRIVHRRMKRGRPHHPRASLDVVVLQRVVGIDSSVGLLVLGERCGDGLHCFEENSPPQAVVASTAISCRRSAAATAYSVALVNSSARQTNILTLFTCVWVIWIYYYTPTTHTPRRYLYRVSYLHDNSFARMLYIIL